MAPAGQAKASDFVDRERLWRRHMDLAAFGATPDGGVRRLAMSDEETEARRQWMRWAVQRGFACSMDPIGNMFVRREGTDPDATPVLSGSHLDSQPSGGRFDGTYGVLAAFEALEAFEDAGIRTRRPIEAVAFTNEEGCRFMPGMTGSRAYLDPTRLPALLELRDDAGISLGEAVLRMREALPELSSRPLGGPVSAFVEAHIEQGPLLEAAGRTVGIVTGIQGTRRFEITVEGEEAHAGTTPRRSRRDAMSAAVAMIVALEKLLHDAEDVCRMTVGRLDVRPNVPSVVPGRVFFTVDFRHPREELIAALGDQVVGICEANRKNCEVTVRQPARTRPIEFSGAVVDAVERACSQLRVPNMRVFSGASHDAQNLFHLAPTGMIFVPCEKGISHNPRENAKPADLYDGARVLADALVELANAM